MRIREEWCMKKILVLSDSHSSMGLMRLAIQAVQPDAVVHLGDHYDDGQALAEEYRHIPFHQVPGNCDRCRCPDWEIQRKCYDVCGLRLFMTHGHLHGVKSGTGRLIREAREMQAQVALYGHTHQADCHREENGMWVLNPGSCGSSAGSVGVIEAEGGAVLACRVLGLADIALASRGIL